MYELTVRTSTGSYPICIGTDLLAPLSAQAHIIIADSYFADRPELREERTIAIRATEEAKSLRTCEELLVEAHRRNIRRGDTLVAIGGGVIQDLATLTASLYMRGLPWIYAPTTAMSMLDSCIGGKSSINAAGIKNLIGNIYPPVEVHIDIALARTLSPAALVSGLSEAVKICFAGGDERFDDYLAFGTTPKSFTNPGATDDAMRFTHHVLDTKRWFIEIDEFDRKERQLLNFGHTFGHAFESATQFTVPHGICIALGMLAALEHPSTNTSQSTNLLAEYLQSILNYVPEVVGDLQGRVDWDTFASALASDKKGTREAIRYVLPSAQGTLAIVSEDRSQSELDRASACMADVLAKLKETVR